LPPKAAATIADRRVRYGPEADPRATTIIIKDRVDYIPLRSVVGTPFCT